MSPRRRRRWPRPLRALGLLVLILTGPAAAVLAGEVPLREVPRAVLDAVRARFPDARIRGADRDREGADWVYELSLTHQGRPVDVILTPEGAIRRIKREIAVADLPPAAARALADRYPGATYRGAEAVTTIEGEREALAYYEIDLVTAARRTLDVRVTADGRVLTEAR